jgi:thioester reductase-like protein
MYKTGDKGRLLPDGALAFLGRVDGDSQVKLRGIRIELEEVANVIVKTSEGVLHQAAVVVRGSEHRYMVAFVTFSPGLKPQDPAVYLKELLTSLPLPTYMRPVALIPLDRMPTNVNGKLDRRVLSSMTIAEPQNEKNTDFEGTPTQIKLKKIWEEVLAGGSLPDSFHIDLDSDFFHVGGNSILLVELHRRICSAFTTSLKFADLFPVSVLRAMASRIDNKKSATLPPSPPIDWAKEISACVDQVKQPLPMDIQPRTHVLLTGSTGFLGHHILTYLIADPRVEKIHAIAIRSEKAIPQLMQLSPKICTYPGDLNLPLLGLSPTNYHHLSNIIDTIIHNGADVSFLKTYRTLKSPNVGSTMELARLALRRKIPVHFISSAGVARLASHALETVGPVSMAEYAPPTDGSDGYVASKWAGERVLEGAAERFGLSVWIHRPTSIVGPGAPATDVLTNLLHYSRHLKKCPRFPGARGYFNLVPVEDVAGRVVREALDSLTVAEEVDGAGRVCYTTHVGRTEIAIDGLAKYLQNETGNTFREVDLKDWITEATALGMDERVKEALDRPETARGEGLVAPRLT